MRIAILLAAALPALAATNEVTITSLAGTQTNRPTSVARWFSQGEIASFPQPVIGGTPVATYQVDTFRRWRDGVALITVTNIEVAPNSGFCLATVPNHGFLSGERVTFASIEGATACNGTYTVMPVSANSVEMQGPKPNGVFSVGAGLAAASGPTYGSFQFGIITFPKTITTTPGDVSFQNSSNPCHLGDQATCNAAGLDEAGMLAFNSGTWDAEIQATNGTTATANARTMLDAGAWRYRTGYLGVAACGPLRCEVIVEDRTSTLAYDFGWKNAKYTALMPSGCLDTSTNCQMSSSQTSVVVHDASGITAGDEIQCQNEKILVGGKTGNNLTGLTRGYNSTTQAAHRYGQPVVNNSVSSSWSAAPTDDFKSLHPIFVLTFYAGWAGVKQEFILENMWTTRFQDQTYSVAFKNGSGLGTTVYSRASFNHYAGGRYHKTDWDGSEPGDINIDFNFDYIRNSKAIPYYDITRTVSTSTITSNLSAFNASDQVANYGNHGLWNKTMPSGGANDKDDVAYLNAWAVRHLYTFSQDSRTVFMGQADVAGHIPIHYRESRVPATPISFCLAASCPTQSTATSIGRVISIDARPTVRSSQFSSSGAVTTYPTLRWGTIDGFTALSDSIVPVGTLTTGQWSPDHQHHPSIAYLPWLLTGDYYWEEEVQFSAAWCLLYAPQSNTASNGRGRSWGYLNPNGINSRGSGWGTRQLYHEAMAAPSGSPEHEYYTNKLANNAAVWEGKLGITDGNFPPTNTNTTTCIPTTDKWCFGRKVVESSLPNPLYLVNGSNITCLTEPSYAPVSYECAKVGIVDSTFSWAYAVTSFAESSANFSAFNKVNEKFAILSIEGVLNPFARPYWMGGYGKYLAKDENGAYFQTWEDYDDAYRDWEGTIVGDITPSSTSVVVTNAGTDLDAGAPSPYVGEVNLVLKIDTELIQFSARSGDTLTVASGGRGYQGTTAAAHTSGATITKSFEHWYRNLHLNSTSGGGYPWIHRGKTTYAVGQTSASGTGAEALAWYDAHLDKAKLNEDPKWAIDPRPDPEAPIFITLLPTTLNFTCEASAGDPADQMVTFITNLAIDQFTVTLGGSGSWLSVDPTSGTTAETLTASVDCTGLSAGNYNKTISVSSSTALVANSPQVVAVALTVTSVPTLVVEPTNLDWSWLYLGPAPATQNFVGTADGCTISTSGAPAWLSLSSGGASPRTITATVDTTGKTPGLYTGNISVAADCTGTPAVGSPFSLPVSLNVTSPTPRPSGGISGRATVTGRSTIQ